MKEGSYCHKRVFSQEWKKISTSEYLSHYFFQELLGQKPQDNLHRWENIFKFKSDI